MRQASLVEAEGDALTLNILLSDTSHDLRDVDVAALGASTDHVSQSILHTERVQGNVTRLVSSIV